MTSKIFILVICVLFYLGIPDYLSGLLIENTNTYIQADPLLALGLGMFGASLLGGLFSSVSANDTNKKLAAEANALNYKMFQESQDYDWTKTQYQNNFLNQLMDRYNAYNTPVNMMQRYRAAGINPFVAGSSALGQAQSQMPSTFGTGGSPHPVPAEAARVQPIYNAGDASSILLQLAQSKKEISQSKNFDAGTKEINKLIDLKAENLNIDNETKSFELALQQRFGADSEQQKINLMLSEELKNYANADMFNASIGEINQRLKTAISEMHLNEAKQKEIEAGLPWISKKFKAELDLLHSQSFAAQQQGNYYIAAGEQARAGAFKNTQEGLLAIEQSKDISEKRGALISLTDSNTALNYEQAKKLNAETKSILIHSGIDAKKAEYIYQQLELALKHGMLNYASDYSDFITPVFGLRGNEKSIIGSAASSIPK